MAAAPEPGFAFDQAGVVRGPDGVKRYTDLPRDLVSMLQAARDPGDPVPQHVVRQPRAASPSR